MTAMNTMDFPGTSYAFEKPEIQGWMLDLDGHAKLMKKHLSVVAEQTKLMEVLRLLNAASPKSTDKSETRQIDEELKKLDRRIGQIKNEMIETEARVMTFVPSDAQDAQVMLRFISSVLEFGHKIDPDYLADLLIGCSDVIISNDLHATGGVLKPLIEPRV